MIISGSLIPKARQNNNTTANWETRGDLFKTQSKETVSFQLPELKNAKAIAYTIHVYDIKKTLTNIT